MSEQGCRAVISEPHVHRHLHVRAEPPSARRLAGRAALPKRRESRGFVCMDPASVCRRCDDVPTRSRAWATEGAAGAGGDAPRDIGTDDMPRVAKCARETRACGWVRRRWHASEARASTPSYARRPAPNEGRAVRERVPRGYFFAAESSVSTIFVNRSGFMNPFPHV